jgi:elongation factor Ts
MISMAEITAQLVKELRERTGAGMMECKNALVEAKGDMEEAISVLRKRGLAAAAKKATRTAKQGLINAQVSNNGHLGVLVEVNCESDFVARTDDFQALVKGVTQLVGEKSPATVADLLQLPLDGHTVDEVIKSKIAKLGENMGISRFARFDASSPNATIGSYIHTGAQLGVMVEVEGPSAEAVASAEVQELVKDLAMQVAAADPQFIRREDVTAAALEKEKEIQKDRARQEGKPEKMLDKILEGRMNKFYEEICLLEQPYIRENQLSVAELIKQKTGKLGTINVTRFSRFKVGDTVAAEQSAEA